MLTWGGARAATIVRRTVIGWLRLRTGRLASRLGRKRSRRRLLPPGQECCDYSTFDRRHSTTPVVRRCTAR